MKGIKRSKSRFTIQQAGVLLAPLVVIAFLAAGVASILSAEVEANKPKFSHIQLIRAQSPSPAIISWYGQ
jgi:hypothetical protein